MHYSPFTLALSCLSLAFVLIAAEPIKERTVSFEVVPEFLVKEANTENSYAELQLEGREILWPTEAPKYKTLQDGRKYRFELIEVRIYFEPESKTEFWTPELHRVSHGDSVIYDASICQIHKAAMKRTEVPVTYGMPGGSEAYITAFITKFRHYGLVEGGCIVPPGHPTAMTWVCKHCKVARESWKEPAQ